MDVDTQKLFITELAVRTHGAPSTVIYNYAQLIDWRRMGSVVQTKAPMAVFTLIAGIVGMLFAPYYWHELRGMNYMLYKKLKKQLLGDKLITIMPGECVTQLMILPNMAVGEFNFRIFGHDGTTHKTNFTVKLG